IKLQPLKTHELEMLLRRLGAELPVGDQERQRLVERSGGSARNAILLTQFGGLEIEGAMERILTQASLDMAENFRLAEAVTGRDAQIQFAIFNQLALDKVSESASRAAQGGNLESAARFSALWEDLAEAARQVEIFNLDRKQR